MDANHPPPCAQGGTGGYCPDRGRSCATAGEREHQVKLMPQDLEVSISYHLTRPYEWIGWGRVVSASSLRGTDEPSSRQNPSRFPAIGTDGEQPLLLNPCLPVLTRTPQARHVEQRFCDCNGRDHASVCSAVSWGPKISDPKPPPLHALRADLPPSLIADDINFVDGVPLRLRPTPVRIGEPLDPVGHGFEHVTRHRDVNERAAIAVPNRDAGGSHSITSLQSSVGLWRFKDEFANLCPLGWDSLPPLRKSSFHQRSRVVRSE